MGRRFSGPLIPGTTSVKQKGGRRALARRAATTAKFVPKALTYKYKQKNYKAQYKLTKPFKQVLDKEFGSRDQTHWVSTHIRDQLVRARPRDTPTGPQGLMFLIPKVHQVAQGTAGGGTQPDNISSREGSQIKCKSMTLDLTLRMDDAFEIANANLSAIRYKVYLLSNKRGGKMTDIVGDFFPGLQDIMFREGSTPKPWDRFMETWDNPINSEIFTVHDSIEGTLMRGLATGDVTGSAVDIKTAIHNRKMKIKCKSKILRYDTPESTLPSNFSPFLWIGWKCYNGADYIQPIATPEILHMVGSFRMGFDD